MGLSPHHKDLMQTTPDVLYTTTYDAKANNISKKGKVVLCPKPNKVKGRKSVFHNHFWNPIMFKWAPTTLGYVLFMPISPCLQTSSLKSILIGSGGYSDECKSD